jgi:hypothetical protein
MNYHLNKTIFPATALGLVLWSAHVASFTKPQVFYTVLYINAPIVSLSIPVPTSQLVNGHSAIRPLTPCSRGVTVLVPWIVSIHVPPTVTEGESLANNLSRQLTTRSIIYS